MTTAVKQQVPIKMYRSHDRLTVAALTPGLEPEDVTAEVTEDGRLLIAGEGRGLFKGMNEVLIDEWQPGPYARELLLPNAVDGERANVTYSNGVTVIVLPLAAHTRPARLTLTRVASTQGERIGHSGHGPAPTPVLRWAAHRATAEEAPVPPVTAPRRSLGTPLNWLLQVANAEDLRDGLERRGLTVEQFKQLPAYRENLTSMPWLREL